MTVISTQYASGIVAATEKAAIASSKLIGLGDEKAAAVSYTHLTLPTISSV